MKGRKTIKLSVFQTLWLIQEGEFISGGGAEDKGACEGSVDFDTATRKKCTVFNETHIDSRRHYEVFSFIVAGIEEGRFFKGKYCTTQNEMTEWEDINYPQEIFEVFPSTIEVTSYD